MIARVTDEPGMSTDEYSTVRNYTNGVLMPIAAYLPARARARTPLGRFEGLGMRYTAGVSADGEDADSRGEKEKVL